MSDAWVLAELMAEYRSYPDNYWMVTIPGCSWSCYAKDKEQAFERGYGNGVAYDTDLNAMSGVWKVLKERGLWNEFYRTWDVEIDNCHTLTAPAVFYRFLNDLPGQIKAAIKVLEKHNTDAKS